MSFCFSSWDTSFSESFHNSAKGMLEAALNKVGTVYDTGKPHLIILLVWQGNKPPVIQGRIEVVELSMGKEVRGASSAHIYRGLIPLSLTQPPTLTLLEIGDLSLDRFRGIFRLGYSGDAWLEVKCRVQANPLSHNPHLNLSSGLPISTPLLASQPLLVPMTLRLSHLHLRAILILVVSASKGITLVFKNDPLQNVEVSSTFDSIEVIRGYLQQEIEGQLREMFREDLPGIIHRLSQKWFSDTGVGGKVELPYRGDGTVGAEDDIALTPSADSGDVDPFDTDPDADREIFPPYHPPSQVHPDGEGATSSPSRARKLTKPLSIRKLSASMVSDSPTSYTTFPEIEEYDPTYGMRPEGLPTHSGYEAFGRLWDKARDGKAKGLGSLMTLAENAPYGQTDDGQEPDLDAVDDDDGDVSDTEDGRRSFDMVDMAIALPEPTRPVKNSLGRSSLSGRSLSTRSIAPGMSEGLEWETIPAVGGGTVSRPRIFHVQSQIRAPSEAGFAVGGMMPSPSGTAGTATGGSVTARASSVRSSIGGSTLGHGTARSRLGEQSHRDSYRHQAFARLSGMSSARGPSVAGRAEVDIKSRPAPQRQHSRGESVPAYAPPSQQSSSRLRNSYVGGSQQRTSTSSMDSLAGPSRGTTYTSAASSQAPPSRPVSMAAYPAPKNITPPRPRRLSATFQPFQSGSPPFPGSSYPPKLNNIILPLNDSVSQLATLSHSNHTLSPYARSHEHVAVRSFPRLSRLNSMPVPGSPLATSQIGVTGPGGPDARLVRAKRKRMFKLGASKQSGEGQLGGDVFTEKTGRLEDLSRRSSDSGEAYLAPSLGQVAAEIREPASRGIGSVPTTAPRPALPTRTSYGFPRTAQ